MKVLVRRVVGGLLVTTGEKIRHRSDLALVHRMDGKRTERATLGGDGTVGGAAAAGRFHPQHAADTFAAVDRTLRTPQNLQPAHIIDPAGTQEIAELRRRIAQPHAVHHHLRVGAGGATDEQCAQGAGLAAGGGGYDTGRFIQGIAELQQAALL